MYRKLMIAGAVAVAVFAAACTQGTKQGSIADQAKTASQERADAYAKASALYPEPIPQNFPLRKALVDLTKAQDAVNHPWYVYLQAQQTGQVIAYYVAKTAPQSACNTLSSTQAVTGDPNSQQGDGGSLVLTAPTLNGYYAGGAGASGSCSTYFFQDQSTGANVEIYGNSFLVMDQPLSLNVPRLRVSTTSP